MSQLPKDGYYMATVVLDTGGSIREYVQVQGGKVFTKSASELLPEACSDFAELGPIHFVCVFPGQAAIELEDLRAKLKQLEEESADYMKLFCDWKAYATNLESAGQRMLEGGYHALHVIREWREAKETRP